MFKLKKIESLILVGRIIVFFGSIFLFISLSILLNLLFNNLLISIVISFFGSILYYLLSSTYWIVNSIGKVDNGHELIEHGLFYGVIIKVYKSDQLNLLFLTNELRDKWELVEKNLQNQPKEYYKNLEVGDRVVIYPNLKLIYFLVLIFLSISITGIYFGIHEKKNLLIFLGVFFLFFGFFFLNLKTNKNLKLILDNDGIMVDGEVKYLWAKISNEKLKILSKSICLNFDYNSKQTNLDLEFYNIKPFQLLILVKHFKSKQIH